VSRQRLVHFLTGIRSEYDILAPIIEAVSAKAGLEAGVIVTGAHLSEDYGLSVRQIEADGHRIVARIDSLLRSDGLGGRVKGAALQLAGLTDLFARETPDFLVVMGDREETITGGTAAVYHRIPLVHVGGGDHATDGNVDNLIRHAVTKLAHLHMAASERSARRILSLGEASWRVHQTGAPGLDRLVATPAISREETLRRLNVDWGEEPYIVVIFHPTITDFSEARANADLLLSSLEAIGQPILLIHPNSDPGNRAIVDAMADLTARYPRARSFRYLERELFVNAMRHAAALVGNSSAGILEAPTLKLPVVNVGVRQRGREHGDNVIFVDFDRQMIEEAVRTCVFDESFRARVRNGRNPYGDGTAGQQIAAILADVPIDSRLMQKDFPE
jgi:GDP/UDP-N,N'-diacetylbacillosamine 2-epimerase (hydrolysing)